MTSVQVQPSVFVMFVCDTPLVGENFAELTLQAGDHAARLVGRACKEHGWGAPSRCRLYVIPGGRGAALAIQLNPSLAAGIVAGTPLFADDAVEPGSWLLARVPPPAPPAAAGVTLEGLLGMAAPTPAQVRVLGTIRTRFSARLNNALMERSAADAASLYEDALLVPSTFTLLDLQKGYGLVLALSS